MANFEQEVLRVLAKNGVVIGDDGAITINGAYTLPTTDGTAGQHLETDGNGTVTFETP